MYAVLLLDIYNTVRRRRYAILFQHDSPNLAPEPRVVGDFYG